ncbi:hypothetical protein [Paenibacillus sp. SN-8-1]|uniref:hypothetical protein n=1 Tax=Paenibacillus sp. SN-8-1 TaxID=3435409 RepID=UPI003D9A5E9A
MAKLNVVIPVADVEVRGEDGKSVKYRKVDRRAQAGDIVKALCVGGDITEGAFYEVVRDVAGHVCFVDDVGDERPYQLKHCAENYEVYEKVTEPAQTPAATYREVDRKALKGERIRIVDPIMAIDYALGDEFEALSVGSDGDVHITDNVGSHNCVYRSEYVVLEPIEKPALPSQPKRLKVGDYAKVVIGDTRYNNAIPEGAVVEIIEDDHGDIPFKMRSLVDREERWARLEDVVRATDEEAAAKDAPDPRNKFAVGDKVRLISGGGTAGLNGYYNGKVYEVLSPKSPYGNEKVQITGGDLQTAYAKPDQLVKVSAEELAEIERKELCAQFAVGDTVKLTVPDGETPRYKWGNVENGAIGTVRIVSGTEVYVDFPAQRYWTADPTELTKLSAEEISQHEDEKRWAAIGRKVNEFKAGDLVKIESSDGYNGIVGDVRDIGERYLGVLDTNGAYRGPRKSTAKLIVPVEQRFDLADAA